MRAHALGVRCLAGFRQPSADHPVHEDTKHHQVIQKEENDKRSGYRVSHAVPLTPDRNREQTNFHTN